MGIALKRVYAPKSKADGLRVLVERLWPRGLAKEEAGVDCWAKEVSPSPELRLWYAHDAAKWPEFQRRYRAELAVNAAALEALRALIKDREVTFVFAAKDETRCSAATLKAFLESERPTRPPRRSAPRPPAGRKHRSTG